VTAEPARLAPEAVETILRTLLEEHADAFVAALDPGPNGLLVPMPASVPLAGQYILQARSALDLVIPADRVLIISAWERARATGAGRAVVHLAVDADEDAVIHFLDVRPAHGVLVGIVVSGTTSGHGLTILPEDSLLPPRIGRAHKNELAVIVEVDDALLSILGWTAAEMTGRRSLEFVHPDDQELAIRNWMQMLEAPGPMRPVRLRHKRADGRWTWFEVSNDNRLADPAFACVLAEMVDISDEMAAQEALRARERMLRRLTETLPLGVLQATTDRRVVYTNERLLHILDTSLGLTLDEQLQTVSRSDWPALDAALEAALASGVDGDVEVGVRVTVDRRARRCMVRLRALDDERGNPAGAILTLEDITESSHLRAELERRATHDMLTHVMNRGSVLASLEVALQRPRAGAAAIFVDLDRFKWVNDHLGHAAGDELLRTTADRLASGVRGGDSVGRFGGDEFLIVCPGVREAATALRVAERIAGAVSQDLRLGNMTLKPRASVGVAYAGRRDQTAEELVRRADAAMYESKRRGEGRPVLYSSATGRRQRVA